MAGDRSHHEQVARTEHNILSHLSHHHTTAALYHEVNHLRAFDASHGHSFKRDLETINHHLKIETARMHLPSLTITDTGKNGFTIQTEAHHPKPDHMAELPKAVQHDISREYRISRKTHHHHHPRFVEPSDAAGPSGAENASTPNSRGSDSSLPNSSGTDDPALRGDGSMSTSSASPSQNGFGEALLTRLGLPVTQKNLAFLDKWQRAEGGSPDNPFNTTQNEPGARRFNSAGVKRYSSMEEGLDATVKTLKNGYYGGILRALAAENTQAATYALRESPWGTKNIA